MVSKGFGGNGGLTKLGLFKYKIFSNLHLWYLTSCSFWLIHILSSLHLSLSCRSLQAMWCLILPLHFIEAIQFHEQIKKLSSRKHVTLWTSRHFFPEFKPSWEWSASLPVMMHICCEGQDSAAQNKAKEECKEVHLALDPWSEHISTKLWNTGASFQCDALLKGRIAVALRPLLPPVQWSGFYNRGRLIDIVVTMGFFGIWSFSLIVTSLLA